LPKLPVPGDWTSPPGLAALFRWGESKFAEESGSAGDISIGNPLNLIVMVSS
jgi:hypothetical protein